MTTVIAIDGPAGAGKSTIARRVAEELGFQLVDTGALYRTVAYVALQRDVSPEDGTGCAEIARDLDFRFELRDGRNILLCNGETIGAEIRTPAVSDAASRASAQPEVRAALLDVQRGLGRARDSVLEGRDIGTVVFPDADIKVFLTAEDTERARRRVEQYETKGQEADYDTILAGIRSRDARDSSREHAPLKPADDALFLDSTDMDIDAVVARIVSMVGKN